MNSSLAYSKVLLTPPVHSQPDAVYKRDDQNDSATSDFQQTLHDVRSSLRQKDVHDSARCHDEKLAAASNTKATTSVDDHQQAHETSPQKISDDTRVNDHLYTQDKTANPTQANNKLIHKTDDTTEDAITTTAANIVMVSSAMELPQAFVIASVDADGSQVTAETSAELKATHATVTTHIATSDSTVANLQPTIDLTLPQPTTQHSFADPTLEPTRATSDSQWVEQRPAILPITDQTTLTHSPPVRATIATDVSELFATNTLSTENPTSKTINAKMSFTPDVASELVTALATELATKLETKTETETETKIAATPAQTVDAKSAFEKLLQTATRLGTHANAQDDKAPVNATNNTDHSHRSTHPHTMDALLRLSDAQTPVLRSFVVQTAVAVPVGQPQWSQAVGERVLWLAAQNVTSAEISLHPKDLGPIQVKISVHQEQASINFTSHHAVVREVLDQNLNRLRDMFTEQGLNLVNVDVSDKSFNRQQGEGKEQQDQGSVNTLPEDEIPIAVSAIVQQRLVDHYA